MNDEAAQVATQDDAALNPSDPFATQDERDLGAIWDRMERDNGAARGDDGKFASAGGQEDEPAEEAPGDDGAEPAEAEAPAETAAPAVPLPSNWNGKEELWGKIPAEIREPLRAMQEELHQRQSQMGRELSAYKPIGEVVQKYGEYFGGELGNYKPSEAIDYLFGLQRQMDDKPVETLLQIADTYQLRPKLAQLFGGQAAGGDNPVLLARIDQLENLLRQSSGPKFDPSIIDQRLEEKLTEKQVYSDVHASISRVEEKMPLMKQVAESDLVYFVNKARGKLGDTASYEAVYQLAGEMAINADPDLRAKSAAGKPAAGQDPAKVAAAKRANESNLRSTSPEKGRRISEDDELAQIWDKNHRA
jgi:hypothetical protein